jgi:hypothetical protein
LEASGGLAETLLRDGQVRAGQGDLAGAAAWKRACSTYDARSSLSAEQAFYRACCHACLSSLGGRPGSGISAEAGPLEAGRAMTWLRRYVASGRRSPDAIKNEAGLAALKSRLDFQRVLLDLSFPAEPFAGARSRASRRTLQYVIMCSMHALSARMRATKTGQVRYWQARCFGDSSSRFTNS